MSAHIRKEPSDEHVVIASDIFKLVSDPTRLKILWALLHGEHSVGELAEDIKAKPAAVSQHLSKLRAAHMVLFVAMVFECFIRLRTSMSAA
jgi:DNA-binding transcriptional ArsR family regulator